MIFGLERFQNGKINLQMDCFVVPPRNDGDPTVNYNQIMIGDCFVVVPPPLNDGDSLGLGTAKPQTPNYKLQTPVIPKRN